MTGTDMLMAMPWAAQKAEALANAAKLAQLPQIVPFLPFIDRSKNLILRDYYGA